MACWGWGATEEQAARTCRTCRTSFVEVNWTKGMTECEWVFLNSCGVCDGQLKNK